jgi:predicted SAM-dependent methyltransferase
MDLEQFPYPWENSSIDEILLSHVLEHLGESKSIYLKIIQELYRICKHGAIIHIHVPHPRHDDFINDPTHVRIITVEGLKLFDQSCNHDWIQRGCANTPLGLYLGVDFRIQKTGVVIENNYLQQLESGTITVDQVMELIKQRLNVCKEMQIDLMCFKQ